MRVHGFQIAAAAIFLSLLLGLGNAQSAIPATGKSVTIAGVVHDNKGQPVVGAQVTIAGAHGMTRRDGQFRLRVSPQDSYGLVIEHRDFAYYAKELYRASDDAVFSLTHASRATFDPTKPIVARDVRRPEDCEVSPAEPRSEIPCGPGFAVTIPANALADDTGRPPAGLVEVKLGTFEIQTESMPGPFSVAASDTKPTPVAVMTPYGAGMVEIYDAQTGRRLNLAKGARAHIEIPIHPLARRRTGDLAPPAVIPLLRFNETMLRWVHIGSLSLVGDSYGADVDHLTEFNADTQNLQWGCLYIQFWGVPPVLITQPPRTVMVDVRASDWGFDSSGSAYSSTVDKHFTTLEKGSDLNWTYQLVYNLKPNTYYWSRAFFGSVQLTDDSIEIPPYLYPQTPQQPPLPKPADHSGVCTHLDLYWDSNAHKQTFPVSWKDIDYLSGAVSFTTEVSVIRSLEDAKIIDRIAPEVELSGIGLSRDGAWVLVQTPRGRIGFVPFKGADLSRTRRPQKPRPGPPQNRDGRPTTPGHP